MKTAFQSILYCLALVLLCLGVGVCDPTGEEPTAVQLPILISDSGIVPCTNDQGWTVKLSSFRAAIKNIELTIEGETHASLQRRLRDLLVPVALAHPGHYAGGDITGELSGAFVVDFLGEDGGKLGDATLLPGEYHGVNLWFRSASADDGLAADDPLLGHTAVLSGTATKEETTVHFTATLDVANGTQMVGGPFVLTVDDRTSATLGLTAFTIDPSEQDTLFDGLDFGALDEDGDGQVHIEPGATAHNLLMKTLIRHDHWGIETLP